jgi:hypothetical protein
MMAESSELKPTLRIACGRFHISGWPAILLAPLAIPVILLIVVAERLFRLKTSADLTARDVEGYLRDFLEGTGGEWDWDDFTSIKITDPALDAIREEAAWVDLPLTEQGGVTLSNLLAHVRAM